MAILTGLPPGARSSAGSSGQSGADAGIEALLAGRALAGEAGNDASGAAGSDPFSSALQAALSRVGAGLQEEQQALLDTAALTAQGQVGQILPNGVIMGPEQQANFAAATPTSDAQLQAIDAAAQLASQSAGQAVDAALAQQAGALTDDAAAQQALLAARASADQQALAGQAAQDLQLTTAPTTPQTSAAALQLTPEQLAAAQAAAAQQTAGDASDAQAADVDPAMLAALSANAAAGPSGATQANGQQTAASTAAAASLTGLAQVGTGVQTANQQAANDDQSQGAATDTAGLLSAVVDQAAGDEADRFAALLDKQQMGNPAMAVSGNTQSAQMVSQLSANGQANVQALNAAQTPATPVVTDLQTTTESAGAQLAARTESRVEALRASLGSGPVNMEVLKLTGAGGGRAVIEVTPPNQGPIRLDLQLDGNGKANLVVDGLTDSMKARLESSAGFLRQDMAGMGLTLNLELRERNDGQAAMQFSQQFSGNQSGGSGSSHAGSGQGATTVGMTGPAGRGQSSTSTDNGVNLYA